MDDTLHDLTLSDKFRPTVAAVGKFIDEHIAPYSDEFFATPKDRKSVV